ncbi:Hsp20/alpha crystallin family protein [Chondrinema litorale]|uniref:Hsp20/alpha crystallin family protein n=1 Tax=Chondrinema litorale TaxID=2994555 RepID=UPI0025437413|nr:Hsp20/alpha crystallin family protein [Chondrinema litorale]UZR94801.1 Hsp20/alpha crystallin family protein [Chondrinema litorale]
MTHLKFKRPYYANGFGKLADELFKGIENQIGSESTSQTPRVNISEDKDAFYLDFAAPGLNKEDFNIKVDKQMLTISAEAESTTETNFKRREFGYNKFSRSFELPISADQENISANYEAGILTVTVPKKPESKPRIISIN